MGPRPIPSPTDYNKLLFPVSALVSASDHFSWWEVISTLSQCTIAYLSLLYDLAGKLFIEDILLEPEGCVNFDDWPCVLLSFCAHHIATKYTALCEGQICVQEGKPDVWLEDLQSKEWPPPNGKRYLAILCEIFYKRNTFPGFQCKTDKRGGRLANSVDRMTEKEVLGSGGWL